VLGFVWVLELGSCGCQVPVPVLMLVCAGAGVIVIMPYECVHADGCIVCGAGRV